MRDLFDTQMEITDQLCDQGSEPFAPTNEQRAIRESTEPLRSWMKAYPHATEQQRQQRYREVGDPAVNKRGTVYSQNWHNEALRILNLK